MAQFSYAIGKSNKDQKNIRQEISKISDIEKSIRKMGLNEYMYNELFSDNISFDFIKSSIELLKSDMKDMKRDMKILLSGMKAEIKKNESS